MKQPERVAELLAELRTLTENDFERHRLDVLKRDLTSPPTVEIVDDTHQSFDGMIYRQANSGHYRLTLPLHRAVCTYYFGDIPDGYHIHHVDENPANNTIENLQPMTNAEHIALHKGKGKPAACRTRHTEIICPTCGRLFQATESHRKYCSDECRLKNEYKPKICAFCGKEFFTRHKDQTCCSILCSQRLRFKTKEKTCPICGKKFFDTKATGKRKTCSRECGTKLSWLTKMKNQ